MDASGHASPDPSPPSCQSGTVSSVTGSGTPTNPIQIEDDSDRAEYWSATEEGTPTPEVEPLQFSSPPKPTTPNKVIVGYFPATQIGMCLIDGQLTSAPIARLFNTLIAMGYNLNRDIDLEHHR